MNARFLSISLSLAALALAPGMDALAQYRSEGAGMSGGAMGSTSRGTPYSTQQGPGYQPAPEEREPTAQEALQQNPRIAGDVAKLLPAGTDLQAAASGFANLRDFVAALEVSRNLGIPFADLKAKILASRDLGAAIQALKPDADGQIEARKARARADELTSG
jgi:hypothetical protein